MYRPAQAILDLEDGVTISQIGHVCMKDRMAEIYSVVVTSRQFFEFWSFSWASHVVEVGSI